MKRTCRTIKAVFTVLVLMTVVTSCENSAKKLAKALEKANAFTNNNDGGNFENSYANAFIEALQSAKSEDIAKLPLPPAKDFSYDLNETEDGIVISGYTGENPFLVIPAEIDGYPITEINKLNWGYEDKDWDWVKGVHDVYTEPATSVPLLAVIIPENVTRISGSAFRGQAFLKTVVLPSTIASIRGISFSGCKELANLILPESVTAIDWGKYPTAFKGCKQLPIPVRQRLQDMGHGDI